MSPGLRLNCRGLRRSRGPVNPLGNHHVRFLPPPLCQTARLCVLFHPFWSVLRLPPPRSGWRTLLPIPSAQLHHSRSLCSRLITHFPGSSTPKSARAQTHAHEHTHLSVEGNHGYLRAHAHTHTHTHTHIHTHTHTPPPLQTEGTPKWRERSDRGNAQTEGTLKRRERSSGGTTQTEGPLKRRDR